MSDQDPAATAAETVATTEAVAAAAVVDDGAPKFVSSAPRVALVPLLWSVAYQGRVISQVQIRRLTVADFDAFEAEHRGKPNPPTLLPIYCEPSGVPLSDALRAALDFSDWSKVQEESDRFFLSGPDSSPLNAPAAGAATSEGAATGDNTSAA